MLASSCRRRAASLRSAARTGRPCASGEPMDSRATERFERGGTVVDPRQSLAMWLRAGRARRRLSLDEVARITKIQARILEKLESGRFEGLPAEVFVKGFVRSVARCLGLDEAEALARYGECVAPG